MSRLAPTRRPHQFAGFNGAYLWNADGYLRYDRNVNKIAHMNPGPEQPLRVALDDAFNPPAKVTRSAPAGTYLSVQRLGDARRQNHDVYKLRIASGPIRPSPDEALPATAVPGSTPPIGQGPNIRETFWVDKQTDLPLYSEFEKQIQPQHWILLRKDEFEYDRPVPPGLFDPQRVRKELEAFGAARQKK